MARVVTTRHEVRAALGGGAPGLVPTMGALHEGHLSLIRRSVGENPFTVVSVFVNPTQFGDPSDLGGYPRNLDRDVALATGAGADLIFAPAVDDVYPSGFATSVEVRGLSERWEGAARPDHFRGVSTVVTILLALMRPARTYFGEKDYQQLLIIHRLHHDLGLPGGIVVCPTVRDEDGLALSSRNQRLTPEARRQALALPRALAKMRQLADGGEQSAEEILVAGIDEISTAPEVAIEYLAVVDGLTLEPITTLQPGARALVAVRVGGIRLIDNVPLIGATASRRSESS